MRCDEPLDDDSGTIYGVAMVDFLPQPQHRDIEGDYPKEDSPTQGRMALDRTPPAELIQEAPQNSPHIPKSFWERFIAWFWS